MFYSPLRYPGGKGRLSNFFKLILLNNNLCDCIYVEPYAGGAGIALSLLFQEYVSRIIINDIDYGVYCFWKAVLDDTDLMLKKIFDTDATTDEWKKQKFILQNQKDFTPNEVAFSVFFLNRTNRSGILHGGIIGGKNQTGKWKMDARYNKPELAKRVIRIARYKQRIDLHNLDAIELINKINNENMKKIFYYLDPPYYVRGQELYINHYNESDHVTIHDTIANLQNNWVISYDNVEEIRSLYKSYRQIIYDYAYHAANHYWGKEIILFSNNLNIPFVQKPTKIKLALLAQQSSLLTQ